MQGDGMNAAALVIGYGNPLRGDDGVGPRVAQTLASTKGVEVRVCHELVPELADDLRGRTVAVFVDATASLAAGVVAGRALTASEAEPASGLTHRFSPATLLAMAEALYGATPRAFLVTIGAASFALGEALSPAVEAALPEAVATVRRLLLTTA